MSEIKAKILDEVLERLNKDIDYQENEIYPRQSVVIEYLKYYQGFINNQLKLNNLKP